MSHRAFTFRLVPTAAQHQELVRVAGVCRLIWNIALEQRLNHWRQFRDATGNNLNFVAQCQQLTDLRAEFAFIGEVSVIAEQRVLKNLDLAFTRYFSGTGNCPKYKSKSSRDAFSFDARDVRTERLNAKWSRIRLPRIGWIKFRDTRPISGKISDVTIAQSALGWQVSVGCKIETDAPSPPGCVGIDRGVAIPLMLSDGSSYAMPPTVALIGDAATAAQRLASRRNRGSARHAKQQRRVASLRARQARIRKDWAHRCTTDITRRYGTVVIEALHTSNMTRSAKGTVEAPGKNVAQKAGLNRGILNVGWHQIETMLAYKAGRLIKVNPAYSSQTCASCGTVDSQSRKSQAVFDCVACGHRDNADRNAAIVILRRSPAGVEGSGYGPVEAQTGRAPKRSENLSVMDRKERLTGEERMFEAFGLSPEKNT